MKTTEILMFLFILLMGYTLLKQENQIDQLKVENRRIILHYDSCLTECNETNKILDNRLEIINGLLH